MQHPKVFACTVVPSTDGVCSTSSTCTSFALDSDANKSAPTWDTSQEASDQASLEVLRNARETTLLTPETLDSKVSDLLFSSGIEWTTALLSGLLIYIYVHTCLSTYVYIYIYMCTYRYMYVHICAYTYTYIYIHTHIYMCIYIYIHNFLNYTSTDPKQYGQKYMG